jgi:hypothetical protein
MAENLLTTSDILKKIRVSRATFYRFRGRLIANGLKTIKVGTYTKYLESSLDRLIQKCAEEGRPLC